MMGLLSSVPVLAERILNSIPEGIAVALLAWLLLRLVGKQNSGTKFVVWFGALLAIAIIPLIPAAHVGGTVSRVAHSEVTLPGSWAVGILASWSLIALFAMARLVLGFWRLQRMRRESVATEFDALDPVVQETLRECQSVRQFELRGSSKIGVPAAVGFFHPVILLPEWAIKDLSTEELRTVILHEFAHLRRRDDWSNLAQKVIRAVFLFHPAVWWIDKRLSLEREMACDEAVLAETRNPQAYARCLVSLAEKSFVRRGVAMAQAAVGRMRDTSRRLTRILDSGTPATTRVFKPVLAGVAGLAVVSVIGLPRLPKLISFGSSNDVVVAQDEAPKIARSMMVPAKFETSEFTSSKTKGGSVPNAQLAAHSPLIMTSAIAAGIPRRPAVVRAKLNDPATTRRPQTVQVRVGQPAMQQVLVFTQTTDYYQHGAGIVGVTEWKVMLVSVPVARSKKFQAANRT